MAKAVLDFMMSVKVGCGIRKTCVGRVDPKQINGRTLLALIFVNVELLATDIQAVMWDSAESSLCDIPVHSALLTGNRVRRWRTPSFMTRFTFQCMGGRLQKLKKMGMERQEPTMVLYRPYDKNDVESNLDSPW